MKGFYGNGYEREKSTGHFCIIESRKGQSMELKPEAANACHGAFFFFLHENDVYSQQREAALHPTRCRGTMETRHALRANRYPVPTWSGSFRHRSHAQLPSSMCRLLHQQLLHGIATASSALAAYSFRRDNSRCACWRSTLKPQSCHD